MSRGSIDIHRREPRLVVSALINNHRRGRTSSERPWGGRTPWTDSVGWRREG